MIDLTKPVYFYDDRAKSDLVVKLSEILWKDDKYCLCKVSEATDLIEKYNGDVTMGNEEIPLILFGIETDNVMVEEFQSFKATNDIAWWRPFGWDGD